MISRVEIYEYFDASKNEVDEAITVISKIDKSVDSDSQSFDESIIEQIEDALKVSEKVISLVAAEDKGMVEVEDVLEVLEGEDEFIRAMAHLFCQRALERAKYLHEMEVKVFEACLNKLHNQYIEQSKGLNHKLEERYKNIDKEILSFLKTVEQEKKS